MGIDIAKIKTQVIEDINADNEHTVRVKVTDCMRNIIFEQDKIRSAMKNIEKYREALKAIELPIEETAKTILG